MRRGTILTIAILLIVLFAAAAIQLGPILFNGS